MIGLQVVQGKLYSIGCVLIKSFFYAVRFCRLSSDVPLENAI